MKYYCETISADLAKKLKEKGMPMNLWEGVGKYMEQLESTVEMRDGFYLGIFKNTILYQLPTYAEVFDWLMSNRRITIVVEPSFYEPYLSKIYNKDGFVKGFDGKTWYEAANAVIEKALTLI